MDFGFCPKYKKQTKFDLLDNKKEEIFISEDNK